MADEGLGLWFEEAALGCEHGDRRGCGDAWGGRGASVRVQSARAIRGNDGRVSVVVGGVRA